ncbi:MAG: polysaccharide deacetylase [Chitinophagaceae bacterium]|nr:polysaccharide deacetylase [Chitinophagaceae bacterium]
MLALFKKEDIHVTWATVGMLMFDNKEALLKNLPKKKPQYKHSALSNYKDLDEVGSSEKEDPYHFGKTLLDEILRTPFQELASHTFSHYYCLEEGQSKEEFEQDNTAFVERCRQLSIEPVSIVFPRNQYNTAYLDSLKTSGFSSFRGNEAHALYTARARNKETLWRRIARLADGYFNVSGHHTYRIMDLQKEQGLLNIPASRFLRPYHAKLSFMEPLKIKRIKESMKHAAIKGELYHLWWHPHNFGRHPQQMMEQLTEIISYYKYLQQEFGMLSMTMKEITDYHHQIKSDEK